MLYNKTPRSKQNIFQNQSKIPTTNNSPDKKSKESTDVWQDKGVLTKALSASTEPAPLSKGSRAVAFSNNKIARTQYTTGRVKLVHTTIWLHPLVRAELERIAERELLSLSQVGATACEEWVRYDIHRQQESVIITKLRQVMREELQIFGNRIVFFLMKIAFSAEQARILTTNVLKWVAKLAGLNLKAYYKMVDDSSDLAKKNIIDKAPQIKDLMEKWEGMFTDDKSKAQG
jgi:hypothetical protein